MFAHLLALFHLSLHFSTFDAASLYLKAAAVPYPQGTEAPHAIWFPFVHP